MGSRLIKHVGHLPEDTDHVLATTKRHRADLDRDAPSSSVDHDNLCIGHVRVAQDLAGEEFACPTRLLGRHDRRELLPDLITDQRPRGAVHPADDARAIDDVSRDVHALERRVHVRPHCPQRVDRHAVTLASRDATRPCRRVLPVVSRRAAWRSLGRRAMGGGSGARSA
jgi:hypothetical protein